MSAQKNTKDQQLRKDLARATAHMVELRQRHLKYDTSYFKGYVDGLELALHALHVWTDGEFGADYITTTNTDEDAQR
ncbi:hypothetical protein [Amycolatopsis panacis]|uniref:Uncharacterized protein n=1 Tax=Amycolatopsis panacis TaxID=2340917 RepID=A0A419IBK4_9PSEU|nr:hypothetical protein [Amycolatopsis panacis]RJQ92387.1 hypothetical protein D5S19_01080 [Amycolatopsis panacis]